MIDIGLVKGGRRVMNSKEKTKKTTEMNSLFFCYSHIGTEEFFLTMNDIRID